MIYIQLWLIKILIFCDINNFYKKIIKYYLLEKKKPLNRGVFVGFLSVYYTGNEELLLSYY